MALLTLHHVTCNGTTRAHRVAAPCSDLSWRLVPAVLDGRRLRRRVVQQRHAAPAAAAGGGVQRQLPDLAAGCRRLQSPPHAYS
jgi:hypothetical protein